MQSEVQDNIYGSIRLDVTILKVFSNLNNSMPIFYCYYKLF